MRTKCRYADAYQAKRAPTCGCTVCAAKWAAKEATMSTKPTTTSSQIADVVKTADEIAREIDALHAITKALEGTRLKRKALLVLLAHETGMSQRDIDRVLNGLQTLRASVLK